MLVTNGLRFGGAERVVQALAEDLTTGGHQAIVVATTRDGPIGDALRSRGIRVEVLGLQSVVDVRVPYRLRRLMTELRPDIVHSHLAVADIAVTAALAPRRMCTVHNPGVELDPLKRWLWHRALARMHAVAAVSDAVRRSLPVDARLIRPSLVTDTPPQLDRSAARERLGLPLDRPVVLGIGRLHPIKGFDVLAVAAQHLDALVAVIGEGSERARLCDSKLRLLGPRDDAGEVIAAADLVVVPSRSEGFPQVPLQAMAAGLPVVATRVGGTPEVVVDGQTGILVPPEDPTALADAIQRVLASPDVGRRWGRTGRARLSSARFTRRDMTDHTLSVYRQVVADVPGPRSESVR